MRRLIGGIASAALLFTSASFAKDEDAQTAKPEKHHSLAKGAAVGAVGGHFVGKGHAKAGAATGALVQHHKNKKAEKAAEKGE